MFYYKFPDFPLLSRMDAVAEYLIDEYETSLGRDLSDDVRGESRRAVSGDVCDDRSL